MPKHPLIEGKRVSARRAEARIVGACADCFRLSARGPASPTNVDAAYVDAYGGVAFVYDDGTWVVLTKDDRTNRGYMDDMAEILASDDWPFSEMEVRGGQAVGTDTNPHGPAALLWVEDGYLWEILGQGGRDLNSLLKLAESL